MAEGEEPKASVSLAYEGGFPEQLDASLGALRGLGLRATFYLSPTDLLRDPRLWRALAAEGHEIGMHPFRGVTDERGNLPNWTIAMVAEELDETTRLFEEILPGAPKSMMLFGDELTCMVSPEEPSEISYLVEAEMRSGAIVGSQPGRNPLGAHSPLRSIVFESAEGAILQTVLAEKTGEWLILRFGNLLGQADAHDELCRWLVKESQNLRVAPVVELALQTLRSKS